MVSVACRGMWLRKRLYALRWIAGEKLSSDLSEKRQLARYEWDGDVALKVIVIVIALEMRLLEVYVMLGTSLRLSDRVAAQRRFPEPSIVQRKDHAFQLLRQAEDCQCISRVLLSSRAARRRSQI